MKRKLFLIFLFTLFLSACGSGLSESEARWYATLAAQGTPPPPEYQTAAAIYLGVTLTPTPPQGAPTMSMMEFSYTQVAYQQMRDITQAAEQQNMALTQQANELALEREKINAEQRAAEAKERAANAEATARAVDAIRTAQAQATNAQGTAFAQATQAQGTAYWQSTATQQNLVWIQQTQAAHGLETATAAMETKMVQPTHAAWTQTAVVLDQRIKEGQARDVELATRRQEMKNGLDAYGPWFLVIGLSLAFSDGFRKWVKTRIFKRDEHGKAPVIAMEKEDGTTTIVKTENMYGPIIRVDKAGNVDQPKTIDDENQSDVTRRSQAIEAISLLPTPYAQQAGKIMNGEFGRSGKPNVTVREDQALRPVFEEVDAEVLED